MVNVSSHLCDYLYMADCMFGFTGPLDKIEQQHETSQLMNYILAITWTVGKAVEL